MEKATKKQLDFINVICKILEIKKPKDLTKQEASDFIDKHSQAYYQEKSDRAWNSLDLDNDFLELEYSDRW